MTEGVRAYLLSVCAAALFVCVLSSVSPEGIFRRLTSLAGGLLFLIVVLSPMVRLDLQDLAEMIQWEEQAFTPQWDVQEQMETFIKGRCREYIVDKAAALELEVSVSVETQMQDNYPVPAAVTVWGSFDEDQRARLSQIITRDLGIPQDCQEWIRM